jgi:hypothetical protein
MNELVTTEAPNAVKQAEVAAPLVPASAPHGGS